MTLNVFQSQALASLAVELSSYQAYLAQRRSDENAAVVSSAQITNSSVSNAQTAGTNAAPSDDAGTNTKWILVGVLTTVGVVTIFAIQWAVRHVRRLKQQTAATSAKVAPMHWDDPQRARARNPLKQSDDLYLEDA